MAKAKTTTRTVQLLKHVYLDGEPHQAGEVVTRPLAEANYFINNGTASAEIDDKRVRKHDDPRPLSPIARLRRDQRATALGLRGIVDPTVAQPDDGKALAAAERKAKRLTKANKELADRIAELEGDKGAPETTEAAGA